MGLGLVLPGERLVLGWHTLQDKTDGGGGERKSGVYGWKGTSDGEACGILDGSRMWFSYLVWCRSRPQRTLQEESRRKRGRNVRLSNRYPRVLAREERNDRGGLLYRSAGQDMLVLS